MKTTAVSYILIHNGYYPMLGVLQSCILTYDTFVLPGGEDVLISVVLI